MHLAPQTRIQSPVQSEPSLPSDLSDVDRERLQETDEEFVHHDWADLRRIIETNSLDSLRRKPSDLRRYIIWSSSIKSEYGNVINYICRNRLFWPVVPDFSALSVNPVPFADPRDYKILRNDWPYGLAPGISHLVVWLKNDLSLDPRTGDLTPESRALIQAFVNRTFVDELATLFLDAQDRVMWFKNWAALQSVRAVPHIHVLLHNVPDHFIAAWTAEPKP